MIGVITAVEIVVITVGAGAAELLELVVVAVGSVAVTVDTYTKYRDRDMLTNDAGNAVRPMLRYSTQCTHVATCQELTFAGPDALDPCVIKLADIPAVLEPSTTASTTTEITGIFDTAALGAPFSDNYRGCRRRDCFC